MLDTTFVPMLEERPPRFPPRAHKRHAAVEASRNSKKPRRSSNCPGHGRPLRKQVDMGNPIGSGTHNARLTSRHRVGGDNTIETRIGARIVPAGPDGCWAWTGPHWGGYAMDRAVGGVHRFVYATLVGPIADGNHIHHECLNKGCVNPSHLVQMTPAEHKRHHAELRSPDGDHPPTLHGGLLTDRGEVIAWCETHDPDNVEVR